MSLSKSKFKQLFVFFKACCSITPDQIIGLYLCRPKHCVGKVVFYQKTRILLPGNPYCRTSISTVDLLVQISCFLYWNWIFLFYKSAYPHEWGQPYWVFPFSKGSLPLPLSGRFECRDIQWLRKPVGMERISINTCIRIVFMCDLQTKTQCNE